MARKEVYATTGSRKGWLEAIGETRDVNNLRTISCRTPGANVPQEVATAPKSNKILDLH